MPINLGLAYRKPKPEKFTKSLKLRCQKQTHKGGKPGTWVQCRFAVKEGNKKYCASHS